MPFQLLFVVLLIDTFHHSVSIVTIHVRCLVGRHDILISRAALAAVETVPAMHLAERC
jgi:hypothetical protein